jgi:SNF family Na+-dependent transporter
MILLVNSLTSFKYFVVYVIIIKCLCLSFFYKDVQGWTLLKLLKLLNVNYDREDFHSYGQIISLDYPSDYR